MNRLWLLLFLLVYAACAGGVPPPATPASVDSSSVAPASAPTAAKARSYDPAAIKAGVDPYFDSFGSRWGDSWKLSGWVHAVAGDEVLYSRAFGYADRQARRAPNADTSFRIGSLTKQFTSAAVLALVEAGRIRLDEKITDVLPDYDGVNPDATVLQLLTHTAGIPNYTDVPELMQKRAEPHTPEQLVAAVDGEPATFEPGKAWGYSNTGYILLGLMIEARSGESYADYLEERLFDRAGLKRTVVGDAEGVENRALGYQRVDDRIEPANPVDLSMAWSAGGVRSTAADLIRWDRALRSGSILSEASRDRWYTPTDRETPFGPYALGWMIGEAEGRRFVAHGGGIDGFTTFMLRIPEDEFAVVAWSNTNVLAAQNIAMPVFQVAYGGEAPTRVEKDRSPLAERVVKHAAGTYALTDESRAAATKLGVPAHVIEQIVTMEVAVDADENQLKIKPNGQPVFSVADRSEGRLNNDRGDITIEFKPDGGPITGFMLLQGMLALEYERSGERPSRD